MRRCSTAELREKEIINLCDGTRLGYADDFEFDLCGGKITALLIHQSKGLLCLSKCESVRIPWESIECIGDDTILVKLNLNDAPYCNFFKKCDSKPKFLSFDIASNCKQIVNFAFDSCIIKKYMV